MSGLRRGYRTKAMLAAAILGSLGSARADDQPSGTSTKHRPRPQGPGVAVGATGGIGWRNYWVPYFAVGLPDGEVAYYVPPPILYTPAGPVIGAGPLAAPVPVSIQRGPLAPAPPPGLVPEPAPKRPGPAPIARKESARAAQLVVLGDRHFKAANVKRAEERYQQAEKLDPSSATAQLRMAQVAIVRERYAEAAQRLRDAQTAQPGWIAATPDIQSLYGEPQEFARHLNRLESHLQAHPEDRDAWLVLGAEWYLSGRTARAADVFARIDDPHRKPDIALAAFLEATRQH
ncbi:cellulose synthase subunit BcsC [Aquisphaera giovannonii]|uniref:Cellulose synthase subunit BcsC n=1 Tax=Aquisphaera giovannonii TaxID=406548 RepID=A0A5B9VWG2_9BACT|nr:tetratricopeptide repeat protein [Aquisphaera giovannonii]QEH32796.1 cellulose synthase subunit BcsC [Aquisphaera giovannonii]